MADQRVERLLQGEEVVNQWGSITVTTHRVWQQTEESGEEKLTSFALDRVDWVSFKREHYVWLLVIAGLIAMLAVRLYWGFDFGIPALFILGMAILCVIVYVATRAVAVAIGAGTGKIEAKLEGGAAEAGAAHQLLRAVEEGSLRTRGLLVPVGRAERLGSRG